MAHSSGGQKPARTRSSPGTAARPSAAPGPPDRARYRSPPALPGPPPPAPPIASFRPHPRDTRLAARALPRPTPRPSHPRVSSRPDEWEPPCRPPIGCLPALRPPPARADWCWRGPRRCDWLTAGLARGEAGVRRGRPGRSGGTGTGTAVGSSQ